ncbi:MAG: Penicillin-binding protein, 1A family [Candidatus Woesebacteria bacterium GW2011_GWB1_45_5]|uniref:Penicillin-binding protein, 1A family n=1 Tax=Candidatus Woesebacteria bacterium GW2011_GWB1_45_5 TaxID=1618581 RepID=A0A0G1PY95_9BACT|nr:MAG: Penicillin-binding protein, 1A family [Candidatus Woesebacteria bacterium GW2011_GWB1_45_5]
MIKAIGWVLVFIGKPFYFLLSRIILAIAFILYLFRRPVRVRKTAKKKVIYRKIELPEIKFPKILIPKIRIPKFKPRLSLLIFVVLSSIFSFYFFILRDLPSPKDLDRRSPEVSTKIYDRNGNLLYKIYKDKNRTIVPLSQIPQHVRLATLAAEDAEFYSHAGFSLRGISRAFFKNLETGKLQGGSTITQQLVKNALLSPEKTVIRKIKEVILSVEVEATYSKDQILEMYLNEVSYGGTAYGIEEASQEYFGKGVGELNLAEAALLAGLPQSPTRFSPFGASPDLAFERQREVLRLMKINKFITLEAEEETSNMRLTFVPNRTEILAPHFVMYIRQLLVDTYGEEIVEKGGLEVTTSLDITIQKTAEKIVKDEVGRLHGLNVGNGAALVIDPDSGEILAMVGSKDYFDVQGDGQVNVTTRLRQPGSSIKIVNYAYALSHGYSPASIIDDSPITYVTPGTDPYSPKNYDGQFKGRIPLRIALAESRNIPAVKVLASYGVAKMIEQGQKMGILSWNDPSRFGLSLTLGGGGVKLIELAGVYATIANYGKTPKITSVLAIKDYKGKEIWKNGFDLSEQSVDPRVAYMLIDILKDNHARSGEFGSNSYLVIKNHPEVAVKTGTSNNLRDNLTAGFNQDYLVVTWVGNNDNSPMSRIASGITGASPIWNKIMSALLASKQSVDWKIPDGLVKINCQGKSEWFLKEDGTQSKYCLPIPTPAPGTEDNRAKEKVPQIL